MMKTTAAQFKEFKKEFIKWVDIYQLHSWRLCFEHATLDGNNAEISWIRSGRVATVALSKKVDFDCDIRQTAFHEAMEMRYSTIRDLANSRSVTPEQVDEAIHILIRQDEYLIYDGGINDKK
jgi:hypothetical protein